VLNFKEFKVKKFLLIISVFFLIKNASANHYMGGEITWECLSAGSVPTPAPSDIGKYIFYLRSYKDCRSATPVSDSLQITVHNHPSVGSFYVKLTSAAGVDITPRCITTTPPPLSCAGGQAGSAKVYVYKSLPLSLPGVPPAEGWVFTSTAAPRQAGLINVIVAAGTTGMTFRSKMFAYGNFNESPCFDSSPKFLENPVVVGCTGYPFNFSDAAYDVDLDSLKYSWAEALNELSGPFTATSPTPLIYNTAGGFSYSNPLPGTTNLNSNTGEVTLNAPASGEFIRVIKVQAYKGGTLVAEIYRELQLILLSTCNTNTVPVVTPPLNGATNFVDTVNAGDSITFVIDGIDTDVSVVPGEQFLSITASGVQFGTGYTSTTGCNNPPCATLNPPPGNANITNHQSPVQTTFGWRTDCSHIDFSGSPGSLSNSSTYIFTFKVTDRFCNVPASAVHNVAITVIGKPLISAPLIRCASVLPNGNVQLDWVPIVDNQGSFMEQRIYTSTDGSSFSVLNSSANVALSSYEHVGANANNVDRYYFTSVKSGCNGTEIFSDTVKVMELDVITSSSGGIAHLTWNPLASPTIPSSTGIYNIEMADPDVMPLFWTPLGTSPATSYNDIVTVCNDSVIYRVYINDNILGCSSYSTVSGANVGDNTPPAIPTIDVVTVNGNLVNINWDASLNPDLDKYYIYRKDLGDITYTIYDSSYTNTYTDVFAPVHDQTLYYTVTAGDSCGNESPMSIYHQTIFLQTDLDLCNSEFQLKWNSYKHMTGGVSGYNIYAGIFPSSSLIGTTTDTSYTISNLVENALYCMYIEAFGTGTSVSLSNEVCMVADVPTKPTFLYLSTATVEEDGGIRIKAVTDTAADVKQYNLYRSSDIASSELVGSIGMSSNPVITFYDSDVQTSARSYSYEITAIDSCDLVVMTSNAGKTIYASAVADPELVNNDIYWTKYEDWAGGVLRYNIYRADRDYSDELLVDNVPAATLKFNDDISDLTTGTGEFCYYIEAIEGPAGPYDADTSHSNIFCVTQHPGAFIPSAFNPSGVNKEFKPVITFVDNNDYEFRIFNRWGQTVFLTTDVNEAWDGTYDNGVAPEGVYVYFVSYKSTQGVHFERRGTVTLIR
jgi:gliding motility-associated-like protein